MKTIKILIVDDHAMVRMSLASLLGTSSDIEVVGEAGDGVTAVRLARELQPDVIVMDLLLPVMDGADATERILSENPESKILILTSNSSADGFARALETGAKGAVLKSMEFSKLVSAIRTVAAGGQTVSAEIKRMIAAEPPLPKLSPRQVETLQSITRGLTNADIAKQLDISADMVKEHLNALFAKLGAANKAEAVAIALRKHLLKI